MERLTKKDVFGNWAEIEQMGHCCRGLAIDTLAAYEDTELSPAEITKLREDFKECRRRLSFIYDIGFDYDGYNVENANSMKELVDEFVDIAANGLGVICGKTHKNIEPHKIKIESIRKENQQLRTENKRLEKALELKFNKDQIVYFNMGKFTYKGKIKIFDWFRKEYIIDNITFQVENWIDESNIFDTEAAAEADKKGE